MTTAMICPESGFRKFYALDLPHSGLLHVSDTFPHDADNPYVTSPQGLSIWSSPMPPMCCFLRFLGVFDGVINKRLMAVSCVSGGDPCGR